MMTGTLVLHAVLLGRVLTLAEAERTALEHQPQLMQANAAVAAAGAHADATRSELLPQVRGIAIYDRETYNRPNVPRRPPRPVNGTETFNSYDFAVNATQLLWDFGQTWYRYEATRALLEAQGKTEQLVRLQVILIVRQAYFKARALKALLGVANDTMANQQRHQAQIEGFVRVGNRPQIDLVQIKSEVAAARFAMIEAGYAYDVARAELNQAMGVVGATDFDVADDGLPPLPAETQPLPALIDQALGGRPDLAAIRSQIKAQDLTVSSLRGAYWPRIQLDGLFTYRGVDITDMRWNYGGFLTLNWALFQGGQTWAQVREARAQKTGLQAAQEGLRQSIVVGVQSAWVAVAGAREAVATAEEGLALARERLRMAEGRYSAGVGGIIELGDAQLGETVAAARRVQAEFQLAAARAGLIVALGSM